MSFTLNVENVGTQPVTRDVTVRFYLSADAILDGGDTLLVERTVRVTNLSPGAALLIKTTATVASPSRGKFVIGQIDPANFIAETDEGNNIAARQIP